MGILITEATVFIEPIIHYTSVVFLTFFYFSLCAKSFRSLYHQEVMVEVNVLGDL